MITIEFWYEFASTYSYLAAERIESLAKTADTRVTWRPFMLGPIFKDNGWKTSPFKIYETKGTYMWRDIERCAKIYGLPFHRSSQTFPQNGLQAARVALCLPDGEIRGEFSRKIYRAEFAEGENIAEHHVISAILEGMGLDAAPLFDQAKTPAIKEQLFNNTNEARSKGIFGAPSLITEDGELFWGDDRMEQAFAWGKS